MVAGSAATGRVEQRFDRTPSVSVEGIERRRSSASRPSGRDARLRSSAASSCSRPEGTRCRSCTPLRGGTRACATTANVEHSVSTPLLLVRLSSDGVAKRCAGTAPPPRSRSLPRVRTIGRILPGPDHPGGRRAGRPAFDAGRPGGRPPAPPAARESGTPRLRLALTTDTRPRSAGWPPGRSQPPSGRLSAGHVGRSGVRAPSSWS